MGAEYDTEHEGEHEERVGTHAEGGGEHRYTPVKTEKLEKLQIGHENQQTHDIEKELLPVPDILELHVTITCKTR